jgi:uncharacterized repeat protein (TIGR03803 family)
MRHKRVWLTSAVVVALAATLLDVPGAMAEGTELILHSFSLGTMDGNQPYAGLIADSAGNLYGTTNSGGLYGGGVVFKLEKMPDGSWTESVIHDFVRADDEYVGYNNLAFDAAGNLYGAISYGGAHGWGVVYQLAPNLDGSWTENVIYEFRGKKDGGTPETTPYFDAAGNLYGTSSQRGAADCGTVFRLIPGGNNAWSYEVIHQFKKQPACSPVGGPLIPDSAGNLYGTTRRDGGTVYKLTPGPNNDWTISIIHEFHFPGGAKGAFPSVGGLTFDAAGILYGAVENNGGHEHGALFSLTPGGGGDNWIYKVLYRFRGKKDGGDPDNNPVFDTAGNFYSGSGELGPYFGGAFYRMASGPTGWTFDVLHDFGAPGDGSNPVGVIVKDGVGNLYGVTTRGGDFGVGAVYEVTP